MKITGITVFELVGAKREPIAIFDTEHPFMRMNDANDCYKQIFTEVETDEGITGICIGGSQDVFQLGSLLLGEDPNRTEYLWERMYHSQYIRSSKTHAIAILDLALWDLKGKIANEPVYSLLGGHTREKIPAYAAMLGFSTEPKRAAEASIQWIEKGFQAVKWYLPYNETHGIDGLNKNIGVIAAVRKAVGEQIGIIVDFGVSNPNRNSVIYQLELAKRLEPLHISWLEEPLNFDDIETHARLSRSTSIPVALGERWYNRWQFKEIIASNAAAILQPDPYFAMGITETMKIIALASVHGIPVIPHSNESFRQCAHIMFSCPERICPMMEFGIKSNHNFQYFFHNFFEPSQGFVRRPAGPGFGYEIDRHKIKEKNILWYS